jgi:hypothetical protein
MNDFNLHYGILRRNGCQTFFRPICQTLLIGFFIATLGNPVKCSNDDLNSVSKKLQDFFLFTKYMDSPYNQVDC